jgi:hypothetical protein
MRLLPAMIQTSKTSAKANHKHSHFTTSSARKSASKCAETPQNAARECHEAVRATCEASNPQVRHTKEKKKKKKKKVER